MSSLNIKRKRGRPIASQKLNIEIILEAALDVFSDHGYEGAQLKEVAQKVGVTTPLISYHFENKDRFHLVLIGSFAFTVGDITKTLNEGELWWFDNKKVHSVKNLLDKPRISVIFDVLHGSSWRDKKLLASS